MTDEGTRGVALEFVGGTETVTGSCFLVESAGRRILVDCGLYQGKKALRQRNWQDFPIDPESVDSVVLTHAHVDHSGFLPALVRGGFRGHIHATGRTVELCAIVLPDSARIQQEDAAYANLRGYSKHHPALSLYEEKDAEEAVARLRPVGYGESCEVAPGFHVTFRRAGHILGSACVGLVVEGAPSARLAFSGDLGRSSHPLLLPPDPPEPAETVVVESTYGDRDHGDSDTVEILAAAITRTAERGGIALIPAFAVDRTEVVLLTLKRLIERGAAPAIPVYVDSPMALAALDVYRRAVAEGDSEIRPELRRRADPFDPGSLIEAHDVVASKAIHEVEGPAIIVSASGMATGGRVLHHLAARLPDPRNAVLLVGYQAESTRGRRLLDGARLLKMHGRYVPVRAEIVDLTAFSVHAGRSELLGWLGRAPTAPDSVFVVHGEPSASRMLRDEIERSLAWTAVVPSRGERVRVDPAGAGGARACSG